ncbi:MAG: mechanosensitive ion channel [Flavobacteriaceae bacterium]|nr:mechanosensitive ion channel [Flavobacteriaceae bacterium]
MANGLFTVLIGYMLYNTLQILMDIRKYSDYLNQPDEEKNLNTEVKEPYKIPGFTYVLFVILWITLLFRNTYLFQNFVHPFSESFLTTKKNWEISPILYESIFIFFMVIFLSTLLSKIVAFITSDSKSSSTGTKTNKLGSWLLLVRITIISLGILIAFIIAGLPVDRLTIIISALGVGIGFGLQTVVNNLVSGIIIAFEKPVNLDDIIEVDERYRKNEVHWYSKQYYNYFSRV